MKKIYTLFVAVLVSTAAFATEPGDGSKTTGLAIMKKDENTFKILYQPESTTDVRIYIHDSRGKEIFSETVKKTNGFIRPYSFTKLDIGEYSVTIVDGDETFSKKFTYGISESKKLARVVNVEKGKFLVAVPANSYQGDLDIRIYSDGVLAHKQHFNASGDFSQVYNVKKLNGEITFEVTDSKGKRIN